MNLKLAMLNLAVKRQTLYARFTITKPVSTVITKIYVYALISMAYFQQDYIKLKYIMEYIQIF